jgi:glucokinase
MKEIIGVDVGGTLLRAARFDRDLNLLERAEQPSLAAQGAQVVLERLYETIRQVMPDSPEALEGIGLALPGPIDAEAGVLIAPPNLPLKNTPIRDLVHTALGGKVFIGNDADLAGLGEHQMGAGRGVRHLLYITVSTGVGGGIIIDGKPYNGHGQGAEIGHMVVAPDGPLCGCGQQGHLEALSSGTAIAREAVAQLEAGAKSLIGEMVNGDLSQVDAEVIGAAAKQGDPLALEIVRQAGHTLGVAIASLMAILNPEKVVIGGGVAKIGDLLFDPMWEAIRSYAFHERYWQNVPITTAQLGADVGLVGAAALVRVMKGLQK